MCKEAVASPQTSSADASELVGEQYMWMDGFKWSILSMMGAPFLLAGGVGWMIYRNVMRAQAAEERAEGV
jgi:hypothetical protein